MKKLWMTVVTATVALAAMAGVAQGAVYDAQTNQPCPAVSLSGNTVSGGCLVQGMAGEWTLVSGGYNITTCTITFDIRIASTGGKLYAINQKDQGCTGFVREPCTDEVTGATIPWPGKAVSTTGGVKERIDMCFQGGSQAWEEVTFTNNWDASGYFRGFTQWGPSENGFIEFANFQNGGTTYKEVKQVP